MATLLVRARAAARLAPLLVPLLAVGCSLSTDNGGGPVLEQRWDPIGEGAPPAGSTPNVSIQGGAGNIRVAGTFVVACGGVAEVRHEVSGTRHTLRALFTPATDCARAPAVPQLFQYFAFVVNLPPGSYDVRVIHENDSQVNANGAATVGEQTVSVF